MQLAHPITSENGARLAGLTRAIECEGFACSLSLYVRPDADLDGTFKAFCRDECEMIRVNGWTLESICDAQED